MTAHTIATARELASRISDGIHVSLLWSAEERRTFVTVADTKTEDAFIVPIAPWESSLDVFHHPYAYAAANLVP